MSRHLARTAFGAAAAAAALSAAAMRGFSDPYDLSFRVSTSPAGAAAAAGHLGLARAHPDLRRFDSLLTPEAFLLDATHAFAASAVRRQPFSSAQIRLLRQEKHAAAILAMSNKIGGAERVWTSRIELALHEARDGRFEDAVAALAGLAAERPSDPRPKIAAAGICYLIRQRDEGNRWTFRITEDVRMKNALYMQKAILAATLGGAPKAVDGLECLVGFAALEVIDGALGFMFLDGDISMLQKTVLRALLRRPVAAVAGKYKDYW